MNDRETARGIAKESLGRGDAVGWFEKLYSAARGNDALVPWADMAPNPNLVEWLDRHLVSGAGKRALVVGCGFGDDAEELSRRGFAVTAFDIAPSAIARCRERFEKSAVQYVVADALSPPKDWTRQFDFVLESYTLQALPPDLRSVATQQIANLVKDELLIICRGRELSDPPGELPWPLTKEDVNRFIEHGLKMVSFEDYLEQEVEPVRRFRVTFKR